MKRTYGIICALLCLFAAALLLRLAGFQQDALVNIAPVAAMALCFGLFFRPLALGAGLALAALLASDVMITILSVQRDPSLSFAGLLFSPTLLVRYLVYGGILFLVWRLRDRRSTGLALALTPCVTLGFYVVMNTVSWALSAPPWAYAKTLAGWWQSQTVGLPIPGAPPSYVFLRNALIGDSLFTLLFLTVMIWLPRRLAASPPFGVPDSSLNGSKNAV